MQRFTLNLGNPPNTLSTRESLGGERKIEISLAGIKSRPAPIALTVTAAALGIVALLVVMPVHAQTTTTTTTSTGPSATYGGAQHNCPNMGGQSESGTTAGSGQTTSSSG